MSNKDNVNGWGDGLTSKAYRPEGLSLIMRNQSKELIPKGCPSTSTLYHGVNMTTLTHIVTKLMLT